MQQVHIDNLCTEFIYKGSQGHTKKLKHQVFAEWKLDEASATHKHTTQKPCRHLKQETRISTPSPQTAKKLIICTARVTSKLQLPELAKRVNICNET